MLGVGINRGDIVPPISTPEVYLEEPICVGVKLGCIYCSPKTRYTVQVNSPMSVQAVPIHNLICGCNLHLSPLAVGSDRTR